jgi:hypothetical protein
LHDDFAISAMLAAIDPALIRATQRQGNGTFRINGIELAPIKKTIEWGRKIIAFRAKATAEAIKSAVGEARK